MKKIVFLSLFALCLPWMVSAQSIDDDLYYIPSKDKKEKKQEKKVTSSAPTEEIVVKSNAPTTVYTSPGNTTVVVQDRVDKYLYEYKVCGLRLHSLRRLEKMCSGLLIVTGLAGAGITCQVYGMGDEALRMGAAGCGLGILVWLFHLTTDENYCMEMAKNYMVDYLENVCLRKYEKMNQKERTVRVNIENGPAEEEIQKDKIQKDEIQKDEIQRDEVQETEAGTEETPAPVPDHSVVHMQRENRRRERTQNTAKNLAKASAGLAGMDGSKSPEAEEQKDAPEELAKDEMIRQILREFMA